MAKTDTQYIKITLTASVIGRIEPQKRTAKALGLRRINDSVVVPDNDACRGMARAIGHLVTVEAAEEPVKRTKKADKRKAAALAEVASSPKTEAPRNDVTAAETKAAAKTETVPAAVKAVKAEIASGEVAASPKKQASHNDAKATGATTTKAKAAAKPKTTTTKPKTTTTKAKAATPKPKVATTKTKTAPKKESK